MEKHIFYNGYFYPEDTKLLTVLDRGLNFGDGLFELIRCIDGQFLLFERHIKRMQKSAGFLQIPFTYKHDVLLESARKLARINKIKDGELYVEITRGEAPRYHQFPRNTVPNLFMVLNPLREMPADCWTKGVAAITFPDIRWGYCHLKTINLLPNVLAKQMAKQSGAYEAFFMRGDEQGTYLTEGSSSSIFAVMNRIIVTPSLENILPGVTRSSVIGIAREVGLSVEERRLYIVECKKADEVFLTSTVSEVMPVVHINKKKIGKGTPGSITLKLQTLYRSFMKSYLV
jgi:D-alanine transaminase